VNKQVIFSSLRTLDAAKFIEYNSWNPEQNTNRYTVIDMDYKPRKDADEISVMLKAYFTDHEEATLDEIVEHISEQNPASFTGEPARDRQLVSQHLNNMILRKRLGRLEHKHAMEHVDVNLTEEQLSFWVELLDGLERIQSGDAEFLKYYRQRAREIVRDPEACTKALKTYREQSPNVKNSDTPDAMAIVLGILKNRADGLSVRQTIEDLKASKMRTLSTFGARNALNGLVELGLVETTPGKVKTYRLTQPDESHTEVGADAEGERIS
jgi:hypothetical protein